MHWRNLRTRGTLNMKTFGNATFQNLHLKMEESKGVSRKECVNTAQIKNYKSNQYSLLTVSICSTSHTSTQQGVSSSTIVSLMKLTQI